MLAESRDLSTVVALYNNSSLYTNMFVRFNILPVIIVHLSLQEVVIYICAKKMHFLYLCMSCIMIIFSIYSCVSLSTEYPIKFLICRKFYMILSIE